VSRLPDGSPIGEPRRARTFRIGRTLILFAVVRIPLEVHRPRTGTERRGIVTAWVQIPLAGAVLALEMFTRYRGAWFAVAVAALVITSSYCLGGGLWHLWQLRRQRRHLEAGE
jgi:hypothetical protein